MSIFTVTKLKVGETLKPIFLYLSPKSMLPFQNFLMCFIFGVNLADENTGYPLSNSLVMFITGTTVLDPQEDLEVAF